MGPCEVDQRPGRGGYIRSQGSGLAPLRDPASQCAWLDGDWVSPKMGGYSQVMAIFNENLWENDQLDSRLPHSWPMGKGRELCWPSEPACFGAWMPFLL